MSSFSILYSLYVRGKELFCSVLFMWHKIGAQYTYLSINIYFVVQWMSCLFQTLIFVKFLGEELPLCIILWNVRLKVL